MASLQKIVSGNPRLNYSANVFAFVKKYRADNGGNVPTWEDIQKELAPPDSMVPDSAPSDVTPSRLVFGLGYRKYYQSPKKGAKINPNARPSIANPLHDLYVEINDASGIKQGRKGAELSAADATALESLFA